MATSDESADAAAAREALELATEQPLSIDEQHYVRSARAANTLRGYQSDWNEFHHWCADYHHTSMPTSTAAISTYLTALASHGAKVGTMSRRLSAIKFAHRLRDLPDPTENARVVAVWEGSRRERADKPEVELDPRGRVLADGAVASR